MRSERQPHGSLVVISTARQSTCSALLLLSLDSSSCFALRQCPIPCLQMFAILYSRTMPSPDPICIAPAFLSYWWLKHSPKISLTLPVSRDVFSTCIKKAPSLLLVPYSRAKVLYICSLVSRPGVTPAPRRCISLSFCPS